jgi:hypothetical protein
MSDGQDRPKKIPPHDYEFVFGRDRALRGRGWRGLVALGLVVTAITIMSGNGPSIVSPIAAGMHFIFAPKIPQ